MPTSQATSASPAGTGVWNTRQTVSYAGKPFEVAISPDQAQAFVAAENTRFPYFARDVVGAATAASGCPGAFDASSISELASILESVDLSGIQKEVPKFEYWTVKLSC